MYICIKYVNKHQIKVRKIKTQHEPGCNQLTTVTTFIF